MSRPAARRGATSLAVRLVAAVPGGYAVAYLFAGAVPLWLPLERTEAILWTSLVSFAVFTIVVLYAFGARDVRRMCRHLALSIALLIAAIWLGR
ncbi:hypothetical protein LPW26_10900 [Rhodopseudomonas sp. HC1]|uniref:hypothetical protein n=1 Tax=Rhodopseudomonas infernalis TaxID=2897386 RepID=UPI001EE93248|nr:hypothetical protein [Rhodopseudomonas infernalis]MCG6205148.1 hypothetical protein [Rhodopseudomonas infernalis]